MIFHKKETDPFSGLESDVYTDLPSASFFHPGMLNWLFTMIREYNKEMMTDEDELEMFIRMTSPGSFRVTYKFGEEIKAMNIVGDGQNFQSVEDPSI